MMIEGSASAREFHRTTSAPAETVRLRVDDLSTRTISGVSLDVRDGELLGIGGLHGQGQEDLLLALFGAIPHKGSITLNNTPAHFASPRQAMHAGVAFVPGDRASEGLLLIRSIFENLQLPSWRRYGEFLRIDKARDDAEKIGDNLNLVMSSLDASVSSLSGGNAQKVVIGKWLLRDPHLLLLNDPTKGIDVGAKGEFYRILANLRRAGTAILFYSSDDEELLGLCDRVLVMHDGRVQTELSGSALTRANLVAASMGVAHGSA
jgi:ribose transport system ATP-binding protein